MLTPQDLGLPPRFQEFRKNQLEIAIKIANTPSYLYLLDAPTGSGKTLIAGDEGGNIHLLQLESGF